MLLVNQQDSKTRFRHQLAVIASLLILMACAGPQKEEPESQPAQKWVGTWSTSQQLTEERNMPPEPGLSGNTIRQVVRVTIGGDKLRLRLSNAFGTQPVQISSIHVAQSAGMDKIDPTSDLALIFDGDSAIVMQPGEAQLSDPFNFTLSPRGEVAITLYVDSVSQDLTGHPGSRTTSFILEGNQVDVAGMPDAITTDHWYLIDALDVMSPDSSAAIAILGNSITDGRGSGTNKQNRWPDELARRLQENPATSHIAVLNQGIGGNCVLKDCLGPAAVSRFDRDVLNQTAVKWLIILEGINDIGGIQGPEHADEVISGLKEAYENMILQAHEKNIKVYGATLLPFGTSFYDGPEKERARSEVNEWIRSSGKFDAVIDLEEAMRDPENPKLLRAEGDTGDHLHPNETGYRMMAEAIDLALFQ